MQLAQAEHQEGNCGSSRPENVDLFATWCTGWTRFLFGLDNQVSNIGDVDQHADGYSPVAVDQGQSMDLCVAAVLSRAARRPIRRTLKYSRNRKHL